MIVRAAALTVLLLLLAPASALAATPQWHVRTANTGGSAFLLASDARGDRRLVVVDERRRGATHVLELRGGSTPRPRGGGAAPPAARWPPGATASRACTSATTATIA